jgi:hypothetical protein
MHRNVRYIYECMTPYPITGSDLHVHVRPMGFISTSSLSLGGYRCVFCCKGYFSCMNPPKLGKQRQITTKTVHQLGRYHRR